MGTVSVLTGTLQTYAWGRVNAMNTWLPTAADGPHAELWFGAHPNGPSMVVNGPHMNAESAPLLVKLLAAGSPLSIQVHPDAAGVRLLQSESETAGLLADCAVKAEALIALESFAVLAGLRSAAEAHRILSAGFPASSRALTALEQGERISAIREIFEQHEPFDAQAALNALPANERTVMESVVATYAGDSGLPVAFMMHARVLQPGQAMFVNASCLHAYVNGFGVEVMTSSDNVLRLGLTPKQVALEPALSILNPDLQPDIVSITDATLSIPGFPFSVQRVTHGLVLVQQPGTIVLCVTGSAQADCGAAVSTGQAAFLHHGECSWQVDGEIYIARPTGDN